jgi:radical SAM superfamily enzyme YgiQ (UPF0313 family)
MAGNASSLHVAFVPFVGFRIGERRMLELGMRLPGLSSRAEAIGRLPALGVLTLAALTPEPWTVSYHESEAEDDLESLCEAVANTRPTLVAVSALTASVEGAYAFLMRMRERGISTVFGGLHATVCADEAARFADAVVQGEAEPIWGQVLDDARGHCLQRQYRAPKAFDLSLAPVPRFDLLGRAARPRFTLQTQRGCPFACEFCGASRLLGAFREKPVVCVRAELEAITGFDAHATVELADDNTFAGTRDPEPLLQCLRDSGVRYFTEVDWRIGERPEVLNGLAASGCVQALIGIESIPMHHRGMGAKRSDASRILAAIERIQDCGVAVIGCFILGHDGQTRDDIDRLVEFLLTCSLADIQLTVQTPFPGTPLYRRLQREGRLLEREWSCYTLFDVVHQPDQMSADELQHAFHDAIRAVFTPTASARRSEIRRTIWRKRKEVA